MELSVNEISAVAELLGTHQRPDLRAPEDLRPFKVDFSKDAAVVRLGDTLVSCRTLVERVPPHEDRPSEGIHQLGIQSIQRLNQSFHSEALDAIRNSLHKTRALDLESLVIKIGEEVYSLKSDIVIQNDDGGLMEAMHLAILASLLSTKLPGPRGPRPLVLHHLPIAVTFGYLENYFVITDPTYTESAALSGELTIFANAQNEVCGIHKNGGVGLPAALMEQLIDTSMDIAKFWHKELMDQMGPAAPQMLKNMVSCAQPKKEAESLPELQKQIIEEMKGVDESQEEGMEEDQEELDPSILALFG